MKFGLNYISYVYDEKRAEMAQHSLLSLSKTDVSGTERPVLRISHKPSSFDYEKFACQMNLKFDVHCKADPPHYQGMVYAATDSANKLLEEHLDVTHIVHLCDDRIFNPNWLRQLYGLIIRHPDAVAWSVYRSATTAYHRIIGGDGNDVLMTMHDAIGCTTREEWQTFFRLHGFTPCPDIHHAQFRPGNRWATGRDYIQNIGVHYETDWAIDFVGE